MVGGVSAGSFSDAQTTASQINTAFQTTVSFPYTRNLTMSQLEALGYDVQNMTRKCPASGYSITIKNVSYNSTTGLLSLNMRAYCDGQELQIRNPVHWYMPFSGGISGSTNVQKLNAFVTMLVSVLENIEFGTALNDDSTVIYPTIDGYSAETTDANYATIKADAGDSQQSGAATNTAPYIIAAATTDIYNFMRRGILSFNTSIIDDSATITAATLRLLRTSSIKQLGWDGNTYVYDGTLASGSAIASGDYDGYGSNSLTDSPVICPDTSIDYNFTFNAAGLTHIQNNLNAGEYTAIFHRDSFDVGTDTPVWASAEASGCAWAGLAHGTNSSRPYLYITYTPGGAAPVAAFTHTCADSCNPETCSFTDTSTNTPTSWQWEYQVNDGGWVHFPTDDTAQNPANVVFSTVGEFDIRLTATNGAGSDDETKNNIFDVWTQPAAVFSANDTDVCSNQNVLFTDASTGSPNEWRWRKRLSAYSQFSILQNPVEQFAVGLWDIEQRVRTTNAGVPGYCEDTEEKLDYISSDDPPNAEFTANRTTCEYPCCFAFTDTSTGTEESYNWEVDDVEFATTQNAIYCCDEIGEIGKHDISHTVDNSGCPGNEETKIEFVECTSPPYPVCAFSCTPLIGNAPMNSSCTDASTNTPTSWSWERKTTESYVEFSTDQNPTDITFDGGNWDIRLTATNAYGHCHLEKLDYIVSTKLPGIWVGVATLGEPEPEDISGQLWLVCFLIIGVIVVFTAGRR